MPGGTPMPGGGLMPVDADAGGYPEVMCPPEA